MEENKTKFDRMLYVKDTKPSLCAICAIVLNVFYFVMIYQINHDYFYNSMIGVSVITNLLFLLLAFLSSEEVKNYHSKYGYVMIALAVVEIIRIFVFPIKAHATLVGEGMTTTVMSSSQFVLSILYLGGAALFLVVGGLLSIHNTKILNDYRKMNGK